MIYLSAFILGLAGSLHCIGMCGPIALALPVPPDRSRIGAALLYNLGRIFTYALLGSCVGFVGQLAVFAGWQQYLSITCGVFVIVWLLVPKNTVAGQFQFVSHLTSKLKGQFRFFLQRHGMVSYSALGVLNGLLPCGLVYLALAAATAQGSFTQGAFYMALFGAGTFPAMFAVALAPSLFSVSWRANFRKYVQRLAIITGLLLIIRGMNLGIPYLSPKMTPKGAQCCSLKHH